MFGYNEEDIIIFTHIFPRNYIKPIKHFQLPKVVFLNGPLMGPLTSLKGIYQNIKGYLTYFYGYFSLRLFLLYNKIKYNCEFEIYGASWLPFSFPFYEIEKSFILEDGLLNYARKVRETHKINPIIDIILKICGIYFLKIEEGLGSHKNIKKVYLTRKNNDPLIKDKIEILDIKKLWNEKTENQKRKILDIFNIDFDKIKNINKDSFLLLTTSLSEVGYMEYDKEIEIYKKMINKFSDKKIFIKPHPAETKKYEEIFPNAEIIGNKFPVEFLNVIGIKPHTVGTIVSSSILHFKENSEIYIYEGDLYTEYLEKYRNTIYELLKEN